MAVSVTLPAARTRNRCRRRSCRSSSCPCSSPPGCTSTAGPPAGSLPSSSASLLPGQATRTSDCRLQDSIPIGRWGQRYTQRSITWCKVQVFIFGGVQDRLILLGMYQISNDRGGNGPICSSSRKHSDISGEEEEDGGLCTSEPLFTASYSHENSLFWGWKGDLFPSSDWGRRSRTLALWTNASANHCAKASRLSLAAGAARRTIVFARWLGPMWHVRSIMQNVWEWMSVKARQFFLNSDGMFSLVLFWVYDWLDEMLTWTDGWTIIWLKMQPFGETFTNYCELGEFELFFLCQQAVDMTKECKCNMEGRSAGQMSSKDAGFL